MTFRTEVFPSAEWAGRAAERIAGAVGGAAAVVLTGGGAAAKVYEELARVAVDFESTAIYFSDERAVAPNDERSDYGMAAHTLLDHVVTGTIYRIRGEDDPAEEAQRYARVIAPAVESRFDVVLTGMGADTHIAGLFPGAPALQATELAAAVRRPDGLAGVTLTVPALLSCRRIFVIAHGESKADAVRRAVATGEGPETCPARALAAHPDVTFLIDDSAAALI